MAPRVELKALPPEEAIAYFEAKGYAVGFDWRDVWREEHAHAFTVAKAMTPELLQTIREALAKALAEGTTIDTFVKELRPRLEAQGWWGRKEMEDPLTGEIREVQLGSPRRLQVIYETNLRTAYQAGRWERIQATKAALPFLRYTAVQDGRTRPEHRAWHGTILPADDPWWDTHYPPCGFRCRCTVIQLNSRTMARRGWEVSERPIAFEQRRYTNPRTGETTLLERGVDPGFDFNPGKARLDGLAPRPAPDSDDGAAASAAELLPYDVGRDGAIAAFLAVFGLAPGGARVVTDPIGFGLAAGAAMFRDAGGAPVRLEEGTLRALPRLAEAFRTPREIRVLWETGADGRPILVRRYVGEGVVLDLFARSWRAWTVPVLVESQAQVGQVVWRNVA